MASAVLTPRDESPTACCYTTRPFFLTINTGVCQYDMNNASLTVVLLYALNFPFGSHVGQILSNGSSDSRGEMLPPADCSAVFLGRCRQDCRWRFR